jgi:hypothetical protein
MESQAGLASIFDFEIWRFLFLDCFRISILARGLLLGPGAINIKILY